MLDSVVKVEKKYYPQTLLEECKYGTKKTKMENLINNELKAGLSDDETDETEPENETDNDESNEIFAES